MNTQPESPSVDELLSMNNSNEIEEASQFEWSNLLDFNFSDNQYDIPWTPPPNPTSIPVLSSSDGSDKLTRKRDPRLTCENFLAGRIPCSCPELDEKEEEAEIGIGTKRPRLGAGRLLRCQIPGCEVDISQLKGYHKRHRVCLRCANATSVFLDGQEKRYCQQCGKFHILPDFDEGKRSCRRKLERHNKRRRRKAGEFTVAVEKETQVDQLAEEDAIDDKAGKDETPNESEDGNVSPVSSHPGSQSIQSGSVKSFVTSGDTQMGGGKDNPRSPSFGDNKNAYSSLCPTGRISFKLYDWNPAEFPRRLRHQIFQWLSSMPVELEGYIRPGCIILTLFIAMPHFMWEKLSEDTACHIHNFINAPESMLFGRGSITVYLNDMILRVTKGGTSIVNVPMEVLVPRLHYVRPYCFEAGKPMEFVACGSNLLQPKFRFLVSFAGTYLAYDDCLVTPYERTGSCYGTKEDSSKLFEHQTCKIYIRSTDPNLFGPAFIEVENESGLSNFIPVLFGDKKICSEMKMLHKRLDDTLFSKETHHVVLDGNREPCKGFALRQGAVSELLLDIGWLLKEPKLDDMQNHLNSTQIQRFNCLLRFLIQNESTHVLEKILHSLKIIGNANKFYNPDNVVIDADVVLFHKHVEYATEIVNQRFGRMGGQVLHSGNSVEKAHFLSKCYGASVVLTHVPCSSEDLEMAKEKNKGTLITSALRQSGETVPLLNKEVVMNLTYGPDPLNVWPEKTCSRFVPTTFLSSRPFFLLVAAGVVCFGMCAVFLHPNKVGEFTVAIRRCLFGKSNT
ncbi:hypothetical protein IFM89_015897 [Coptis chinensis]|uniref:SBP-type domain-containing protein n=1 Tax=Coptis chinensis TaxID=261450 RepID=A0A835HT47_9MAGN|nr:hypothetical protein IFM89_015897 [Coptis chinensis]